MSNVRENEVYVYTQVSYDTQQLKEHILHSGVLAAVLPTDTVVLKPNFVQEKRERDEDWDYVITHPTIITALVELLAPILANKGKLLVVDSPMTPACFDKILEHMPVQKWREICLQHNVKFDVLDLRDEEWKQSKNHVTLERKKLSGDPCGKVLINLRNETSEFYDKPIKKLYGADYNTDETNRAHNGEDNLYSLSGTIMQADVIINLPKLKCHKKGGITCCLKNMIGINTNKNYLPHHTIGSPSQGGDEFAQSGVSSAMEGTLANAAKKIAYNSKVVSKMLIPLKKLAVLLRGDNSKTVRNGAWYGNDTLWRTILDLNKAMFYGTKDNGLREDRYDNKKRYIAVVDAIYGGEGNGPLDPDKVECGVLLCGTNPVAVDAAAAKIMGFDYQKIPQISRAFDIKHYKLFQGNYTDIVVKQLDGSSTELFHWDTSHMKTWNASIGWKGNIEII